MTERTDAEHKAALQAIADQVLAAVQHETIPNQMAGIGRRWSLQ